jgi:hypothetical protein
VQVVDRRVLEDDRAARQFDVVLDDLLDQLEDRALAGDVRLPIDRAALDVLEAAQGEEVVAVVVIERPLIAQSLPDRVRVGVDVEVVRVVVDVRGQNAITLT